MSGITLMGFYRFDNTLFQEITFPDKTYNKDTFVGLLLQKYGMCCPYIQSPEHLKTEFGRWCEIRAWDFTRIWQVLYEDYEPLDNYRREEDLLETPDITHTRTPNLKETRAINHPETNTHQERAYNDQALTPVSSDSGFTGDNGTVDHTGNETNKETGTRRHKNLITGNVGVTTSQQMLTDEVTARTTYNAYNILISMFADDFLCNVY